MKWIVLLLAIFLLLTPLSVSISRAEDSGGHGDSGSRDSSTVGADDLLSNQSEDQNQTQDQLHNTTENQLHNQTSDQDQLDNITQDGSQDRLQNQTRLLNVTELHDQIQERAQELDRDQANLTTSAQQVMTQYTNASAFVYTLQNQSEQFGAIGPQISQYAMQINNSLQNEIQAQERIQSRNSVIRFFVGGDEVAANDLQQQTLRTQQQIQEMQQLIQQCSCDPSVKSLLQDQLQQMQQQQIQLQQLVQKELQDKGLIGWMWK